MNNIFRYLRFSLVSAAALLYAGGVFALTPPPPGEIERLRREGTLAERIEFAKNIGNNKVTNGLMERYRYNMQRLAGTQILSAPPPASANMNTTGNVNLLVVPIKFSNTTAHYTQAQLVTEFAKLTSFYKQSSLGQLNFSVTVLPWYTHSGTQASINTTPQYEASSREALINAAMTARDSTTNYAQFDSDGGGTIDLVIVLWAGTAGDWSSFWWAYQTDYKTTKTFDGKTMKNYVWMWDYNANYGSYEYQHIPSFVATHEVGHGLGLPDYYDYDENIGPDGGIGGADMMSTNDTDHNAFSKFLLGWITPSIYTSGSHNPTISSQAVYGQALQIMPSAVSGTSWDEYFMAEYRQATGIDSGLPTSGVYVWHVDARLDSAGNDFYYENSYARHKLLRRVEANGLNQIEANSANVSAGSVFTGSNGYFISPTAAPSSKDYQSKDTGIKIGPMTAGSNLYTIPITISSAPRITTLAAANGSATGAVNLSWTVPTGATSYQIRYATWTAVASYPFSSAMGTGWTLESSNGTTGNWSVVSSALQTGIIARADGYGYSAVSRTVSGPATLSFQWMVSSESGFDFLNFLLDGKPISRISGITSWATVSNITIPAGDHKITWEYTKDSNTNSNNDKGYLRNVNITYGSPPPLSWSEAVSVAAPTPGTAGNTQSLTVSGLSTSLSYTFAMRTQNSIGALSDMSNIVAFQPTADTTPPSAVSNLSATAGPLANQITLKWTAPGDNGSSGNIIGGNFEIRYATFSTVTEASTNVFTISTSVTAGAQQSYTANFTGTEMNYWFAVWTYDAKANKSAISNIANSVVLRDTQAPAAVTDLTAVPGTQEGQIKLSWTSPGADGNTGALASGQFIIRYSSSVAITSTTGTELIIGTTAAQGAAQQYTFQSLLNGATYYFGLWSKDVSGNLSGQSNSASSAATDLPPGTPANLYTNTSLSDTITLYWSPVSAADLAYYRVYCDSTTAVRWDNGYILGTSTSNFMELPQLDDGVTYYFRVTAVDTPPNVLESAFSSEIFIMVHDTLAPSVSGLTSPTHGTGGNWTNVSRASFTWSGSDTGLSGLKGYYIKFDTASAISASSLAANGVFTAVGSTGAVFADGSWYFHAAALDNAGNLSSVYTLPFKVDTAAPVSTLALAKTSDIGTGNTALTLTVTDLSGLSGTPVLRYFIEDGATRTVTLSGSNGSYTGNIFIESYDNTGAGGFSYAATDIAGNSSSALAGDTAFTVETAVSGVTGGTVENSDATSVYITPGSVASTVTVTITAPSASLPAITAANAKLATAGGVEPVTAVNFAREFNAVDDTSAAVTTFATPVKISIPYPDANNDGKVDGTNIKTSQLNMYYLNTGSVWTEVPYATNDAAAKVIYAWVSHFSIYSLLSTAKESVDLSQIMVYPQPCYFKKDTKLTIAMLPDTPNIAVYIYTLDGTLVRTMTNGDGISQQGLNRKAEWDGRNSSGQAVASGMYIFLIKSEGSTKTGRLGVFW